MTTYAFLCDGIFVLLSGISWERAELDFEATSREVFFSCAIVQLCAHISPMQEVRHCSGRVGAVRGHHSEVTLGSASTASHSQSLKNSMNNFIFERVINPCIFYELEVSSNISIPYQMSNSLD